jgi:predicted RNA methylase
MNDDERIKALRRLVDRTAERLMYDRNLTLPEAVELTVETRLQAEKIIPDMMDRYDLIYESRFQRLIWQFVLPRTWKGGEDANR